MGLIDGDAPIDEVERRPRAEVGNPSSVRLVEVEGRITIHRIHVCQLSEAKFQVWLKHQALIEERTELHLDAEHKQLRIEAKTKAPASVELTGFLLNLR